MADNRYRVEDYPEIRDHFFLGGRGAGACRALCGRIALMSVFLHQKPTDWSDEHKDAYFKTARDTSAFLEREAARHGATLALSRYHFDVDIQAGVNPRDGFSLIADFFGAPDMKTLAARYAKRLSVDGCVFVLLFDGAGRSFGYSAKSAYGRVNEIAVVFFDTKEKPSRRVFTLSHELLHQYGAIDYYYPAAVREKAERYFANSVMGIGEAVVDDFTAYLVGWRDDISANTYHFLKDTAFMTYEKYCAALDAEWKRSS